MTRFLHAALLSVASLVFACAAPPPSSSPKANAAPEAASSPKLPVAPELAEEEKIGGGFLIAPLNVFSSLDPALEPGAERLANQLVRYLKVHGRSHTTVSVFEFREAVSRAGATATKKTGTSRPPEKDIYRELFVELGGGLDFDAILVPDIMIRSAELEGRSARWDGVRRRVKSVAGGGFSWSGGTPAASIRVRVYDETGERVFLGIGGLDLIFRPNIRTRKVELMEDPLSDLKHLREGIVLAFDPYLPKKRAFIKNP